MAIHQPLELEYWLVNVFSGSWTLFLFLLIGVIAILAGRFRMSNLGFTMILGVLVLLMAPYYSWLMIVGIILVGLIGFNIVSKIFR